MFAHAQPLLLCALLAASSSPALAVSMDKSSSSKDVCAVSLGADRIEVSAYLPDFSRDKYCAELPSTGRAILAFDLGAQSLRETPIEIRIVRGDFLAAAGEDGLERATVAYSAPRLYKGGTIAFEREFKESGRFAALLTALPGGAAAQAARFEFTVGRTPLHYAPPLLGAVLIGGLLLAYWKLAAKRS